MEEDIWSDMHMLLECNFKITGAVMIFKKYRIQFSEKFLSIFKYTLFWQRLTESWRKMRIPGMVLSLRGYFCFCKYWALEPCRNRFLCFILKINVSEFEFNQSLREIIDNLPWKYSCTFSDSLIEFEI